MNTQLADFRQGFVNGFLPLVWFRGHIKTADSATFSSGIKLIEFNKRERWVVTSSSDIQTNLKCGECDPACETFAERIDISNRFDGSLAEKVQRKGLQKFMSENVWTDSLARRNFFGLQEICFLVEWIRILELQIIIEGIGGNDQFGFDFLVDRCAPIVSHGWVMPTLRRLDRSSYNSFGQVAGHVLDFLQSNLRSLLFCRKSSKLFRNDLFGLVGVDVSHQIQENVVGSVMLSVPRFDIVGVPSTNERLLSDRESFGETILTVKR
mmetsp:Transcript_4843/g.14003  ORF Transcript_4843/g.14003 Transcript_4843/m.14003 type:complete len:266 (-) Transcript_4843:539-1336(-)